MITNGLVTGWDANSTRGELQAATFDSKPDNETSPELESSGLLMSRIITGIPVADLSGGYDAKTQLPLERGVAKIACFFAKEAKAHKPKSPASLFRVQPIWEAYSGGCNVW